MKSTDGAEAVRKASGFAAQDQTTTRFDLNCSPSRCQMEIAGGQPTLPDLPSRGADHAAKRSREVCMRSAFAHEIPAIDGAIEGSRFVQDSSTIARVDSWRGRECR
jgi:hypothetical protein